jgi:hypothetical protein
LGAKPRDGLFVGLDLGRRGLDAPRVDDLFESGSGGVVVDFLGRIWAGRDLVRAGNWNELDVDLHAGLQMGEVGFDILKTNAAPKP